MSTDPHGGIYLNAYGLKRFIALIAISLAMVSAADAQVEIRGSVATGNYTWTADNFAGFYYDIDDNIKTESLTTTVTGGNKLDGDPGAGKRGVEYTTAVQQRDFEFEDWGSYSIIGFLAERYFAGYIEDSDSEDDVLFTESEDENVLSDQQLLQILVDDDADWTFSSDESLRLKEGYELHIMSIDVDGSGIYLELTKDGDEVDSEVISPDSPNMADQTYLYRKDVGDSSDVVLIAVHFQSVFLGDEDDAATIDGIWQLSDTPEDVEEGAEYDEMTVQTVTTDTITMDNEDNDITLSRDEDISLMPGISIKTADSSDLRYYIYTEESCAGLMIEDYESEIQE